MSATYNNLAKAYFLAGIPELSVASYKEALRRDPANAVAHKGLAVLAGPNGALRHVDVPRARDGLSHLAGHPRRMGWTHVVVGGGVARASHTPAGARVSAVRNGGPPMQSAQ